MTDALSQRIKELFDSGYYCAEYLTAESQGIGRMKVNLSSSLFNALITVH